MSKVTAFEAKTRFGELLERVMAGEEIVITRHDKAVARIVPEGNVTSSEVSRAVQGLKALQKSTTKNTKIPSNWAEFKRFVEEGRE
jgi:prevent-host-death family protein